MDWKRVYRHLATSDRAARKPFPKTVLKRIEEAIAASETQHRGELRFALEAALDPVAVLRGRTARSRAGDAFHRLGVGGTAERSGVLIYVQLVDRAIEIVADAGISERVAQAEWDAICRRMEDAFRAGRFEDGSIAAIGEVTALLARHFPPRRDNPDELPNEPAML
jgi:uncharacterized membrane protein